MEENIGREQGRPPSAQLNLGILEARKAALLSDSESKIYQHNHSMELDLSLMDESVFELFMMERNRELAELDVEIAEARAAAIEDRSAGAQLIAGSRLSELRKLHSAEFDFRKLVRLCEELNVASRENCFYLIAMGTRAVLDHVPPVFGLKTFSQVANQYDGGKNFKNTMQHLDTAAKNIAHEHLHRQIRQRETLPTLQQVNFAPALDVLLGEIVRVTQ